MGGKDYAIHLLQEPMSRPKLQLRYGTGILDIGYGWGSGQDWYGGYAWLGVHKVRHDGRGLVIISNDN